MRNRFEQQLEIGLLPIEETQISYKQKDPLTELLAALLAVYTNTECNELIFRKLEEYLSKGKKKTGRKGMTLWQIFVLAQVRLCKNLPYSAVHDLANHHSTIRGLLGVEHEHKGFSGITFEYQNIYDNLSVLNDDLIKELNTIIVNFAHQSIFKKKDTEALRLKSDSFVVESNVHFPTDYNLLWDCARKCLDTTSKLLKINSSHKGWRKFANWQYTLKGLIRELGKANASGGKNKVTRVKKAAKKVINKSNKLLLKLETLLKELPFETRADFSITLSLEHYMSLLNKHIDLVERRIIKEEKIPHNEKMFSIFETYTEWINKGKSRPNVELGKMLNITTDQYNLIVDYQIMENEKDRDIVIELADRILRDHKVEVWSFDKGYWRKENKELLQLYVPHVIMPKLGRLTQQEKEEENSRLFKKYKNKHSAIESNINELENRGLDRCPDRGYHHFKSYIGLGVCAFNLKKIGKFLLDKEREEAKKERLRTAA